MVNLKRVKLQYAIKFAYHELQNTRFSYGSEFTPREYREAMAEAKRSATIEWRKANGK